MSTHLLDLLKTHLTSDVVSKLAGFLGESTQKTAAAVDTALPSLLAGLIQKTAEPQGADKLFHLLSQGKHDGSLLDNIAASLSGGTSTKDLLATGATLLNNLFGNKVASLTSLIASNSGISTTSSASLLRLAMPLVVDAIGKTVQSDGIANSSQLANLLNSQSGFLKSLLPSGLGSILGLATLDNLGGLPADAVSAHDKACWLRKLLLWLLFFGLLAVAWGLLRQLQLPATTSNVPPVKKTVVAPPVPAVPTPQPAPSGTIFEQTLSTGYALKGALTGIESKLIAFINDVSRPVDKDTWFTMDGITFDTGKATLRPESNAQMTNIFEIMKAYPALKIKIGGYTDNTGNAKANLKLSSERANSIKNVLISMGIDAARVEAEGYGSKYPVASNDTEKGRQQNRRIDVRVLAK